MIEEVVSKEKLSRAQGFNGAETLSEVLTRE
jgi:hypothetical protein